MVVNMYIIGPKKDQFKLVFFGLFDFSKIKRPRLRLQKTNKQSFSVLVLFGLSPVQLQSFASPRTGLSNTNQLQPLKRPFRTNPSWSWSGPKWFWTQKDWLQFGCASQGQKNKLNEVNIKSKMMLYMKIAVQVGSPERGCTRWLTYSVDNTNTTVTQGNSIDLYLYRTNVTKHLCVHCLD